MKKKNKCIIALVAIIWIIINILIICDNREYYENTSDNINNTYTGELNIVINKEDKFLRKYTEEFNHQYPDLKINFIILSDYENELYNYIENNDYGDVLLIPNFIDYSKFDKYFIPLGDVSSFSKMYNFAEVKTAGNLVYGIPSNVNANGFIYNKKVFELAGIETTPRTIDEFIKDLYLIKDNTDAIPIYTNFNEKWAMSEWEDFCYGAMTGDSDYRCNKFVNEEEQFLYNKPHYIVYKLLFDIVKNGLCEKDPLNSNWEKSKKMINEGEIGCMPIDSWAINQIKEAGSNPQDIGYMAFPNTVDGNQNITISADYCYAVSANSNNKEAAKEWINYIINETSYDMDDENISTVKSDPLPKALSNLGKCQMIMDDPYSGENEKRYLELSKNLNLYDGNEQQRIVKAALGMSNESFENIMTDWNKRWESNRTIPRGEYADDINVSFFTKKERIQSELNEDDRDYIRKQDILKVGYLEKDNPIQYKNKAGHFSGIASDVFEFISNDTGINFKYIPCETEQEEFDMLQSGEIDMIAALEDQGIYDEFTDRSNLDKLVFTKDYLNFNNIIIRNRKVKTDNIDNLKVAFKKGTISDVSSYPIYPGNIKLYDDFCKCLEAVNKGEVDYTYGNFYNTSYYTSNGDYPNIVLVPIVEEKINVKVAFNKEKDRKIVSIINKSIYNISRQKMQAIIYNNTSGYIGKVSLKKFIKSNYVLSIVVMLAVNIIIIIIVGYIIISKIKYNRKIDLANKRYEQLSDLSDEYIFEFDYINNILYFSVKFQEYFGYPKSLNLESYDGKNSKLNEFISTFEKMKYDDCEEIKALYSIANGKKEWFKAVCSKIDNNSNIPISMIGKLINIDKEISERNILLDKALRDQLTGVYNRDGFKKKVTDYIKFNSKKTLALFVFDMDGFKEVNDTFGHQEGDKLLITLCENLKYVFGESNIGRWGGDEFLGCITENVNLTEIKEKSEQICKLMNTKVGDKNKIQVSVSIGICYSKGSLDFDEIFEKADKALYKVKKNGKNNYHIYIDNEDDMS